MAPPPSSSGSGCCSKAQHQRPLLGVQGQLDACCCAYHGAGGGHQAPGAPVCSPSPAAPSNVDRPPILQMRKRRFGGARFQEATERTQQLPLLSVEPAVGTASGSHPGRGRAGAGSTCPGWVKAALSSAGTRLRTRPGDSPPDLRPDHPGACCWNAAYSHGQGHTPSHLFPA